jgi:hypothetical protein
MPKKPIKVFWSELGGRFYASAHYKQEGNHVIITGEKFDVTNDIAAAIEKHEITFSEVKE